MADSVIQALEKCWKEKVAVDDFVHKRLIYAYLYVDVFGEGASSERNLQARPVRFVV